MCWYWIKSIRNTFSVRLSRSAESATEAISVALHSVSHALNGQSLMQSGCYRALIGCIVWMREF